MQIVLEIHLVLAFLAALCALVFSWTPVGRRVVNAVVELQFLAGLTLAGVMAANHEPLPPAIWLHLLVAILVVACYGVAVRTGKRAGGSRRALVFSIIGLALVLTNIALGSHIAGMF
jgi:hypothetical membrane protein